ncbi:phenylacetate--CoA ligase family protein [Desulfobacula phenolica]|uniref:Phenylacetate-CoA ligase n=1 Tax=Desulfobacula phenolica TaxID=90732 RepID=A0A1H2EPT8_9BACT|nr:phenylacetate--CoA ligase family protein [Desulfobacula phenolica]SDT97064.1 phenylacetate-CoA ligase [Desulfobacula phenolica]
MYNKIVKHLIFPLHEKILGRDTFKFLDQLSKEQYLPEKEIKALQFRKLKELLMHSQKNIPFYAERFAAAGFDPEKMKCIEEIKVLPLLSKEEIRQNLEDMKWNDSPGGLHRYNTGGSSGKPLVFYFDRRRQAYDAAARALTHQWWDVDVGDKELYLWGSPLEITKQDKLKDFRDKITNDLLISAFEISEQQIPDMVRKIKKFKPKCVFGYPSTIALFCKMAGKKGYDLANEGIKVVFSTAEVLYDGQRKSIGLYFGGVPVVDCYGSREGGFVCQECKEGKYHVVDSNYIIEYLKDGKDVGPGEDGEVVLTHLDAWGMPFVRYRTGDVAQPGESGCACGRTWSIVQNIQGRTTDFVVTPDGRWQHALSVIYVVRDIEGVDEFKILQHSVDDIEVLLKIHDNLYPGDGEQRIVTGFKKRMGDSVDVRVTLTDSIPRDASGKYRYVVSKVGAFNKEM